MAVQPEDKGNMLCCIGRSVWEKR